MTFRVPLQALLPLLLALAPLAHAGTPTAAAAGEPQPQAQGQAQPPGFAIASAHALATDAGSEVLRDGGNAFDAAIAVSAVLSVVEPISSGIGGGGFFLLHDARSGRDVFLDARETAPESATPAAWDRVEGTLSAGTDPRNPVGKGVVVAAP